VTKHYFSRNGSMSLPVRAMLPTNPTADQGYDFAKFLSRAAEPKRRKSRLMSPMSWATWTGAYDEDGQTGPGTRRGTILTEEVAKLRPAKKLGFFGRSSSDEDKGDLEVDEEKMTQADQVGVPTFSWTEGYAGDTIPSAGDTPPAAVDVPPEILAEFGGRRPSPSPRTRRLPSQAPGFSPVREEEDPLDVGPMDISPFSTASGSRLSPFSTANGRDISPFSTTYGREVSPFSAGPSRSRAVSYDMLSPQDPVPPDQVDSVDYPSPSFPAHEGRDALDVPFPLTLPHRRSSPGAPFSHRRSSPGAPDEPNITPPPHARRISISIKEPDHPRRKSSALSHKSSSPGSRKILLQASQPRRPSPILNISIHSEDSSFVTAGTSRPTQSNESSLSGRSDFSVSPASNLSTSPAPASLLVPSAPSPIGSGALTPALAETGADTFAGDALQMRRQSIGLESIVKWHEGRANLESVVMEMMEEVGQGGWVSVNACGPKSLLDSARNTVSDLSSVKSVWQGGVGVSFHSETFGW